MNSNPWLGEVLGGLFGGAPGAASQSGAAPALPAGLGNVLAGVLGGGGANRTGNAAAAPARDHTGLLLMLLPLAMRWVQRSGGLAAVLQRFHQQGAGAQAQSWVSGGVNHALDPHAVQQVVGHDALADMAQRLGVPEQEIVQAFAEVMPQLVDKLTPQGVVPPHVDQALEAGQHALEQHLQQAQGATAPS